MSYLARIHRTIGLLREDYRPWKDYRIQLSEATWEAMVRESTPRWAGSPPLELPLELPPEGQPTGATVFGLVVVRDDSLPLGTIMLRHEVAVAPDEVEAAHG